MTKALYQRNSFVTNPKSDEADEEAIRQRQQRFVAAKKIFNEMSLENTNQYKQAKLNQKSKMANIPKNHQEVEERVEEINSLQSRLAIQQQQFGAAQLNAQNWEYQQQESARRIEELKKKQDKITRKRYKEAVKYEAQKRKKLADEAPEQRIKKARDTAQLSENQKLQNYQNQVKEQVQKEKEIKKKEKEAKLIHRPPPSYYLEMFSIPEYGDIPVNNDVLEYQEEFKQHNIESAQKEAKRQRGIKNRTHQAIYRFHCEKNLKQLDKEAKEIYKYEQKKALEKLKRPPPPEKQGFHPTYMVDDRQSLKEKEINLVFFADDPPLPRDQPPPKPFQSIPTSPTTPMHPGSPIVSRTQISSLSSTSYSDNVND